VLPPENSFALAGLAHLSSYAAYVTVTSSIALGIRGIKISAADLFALSSAPQTFVNSQLLCQSCTVCQRLSVSFLSVLRTCNCIQLTSITAVVKNYFDFFSPPRSRTRKQRWTENSSNQNLSKSFLNFFLLHCRNLKYEGILGPKGGA
jgi:hypothetical protein